MFLCGLLVCLGIGIAQAEPGTTTIRLFNSKDLTNFYTFLKGYGKNNDPEKVFTVQDGVLRISGKVFGALTTEQEYADYRLIVEFKWGEQTWPPREQAARDSGILLHCVGADGAYGGMWMESVECQIIEGGTGDFILVGGKDRPRLTVEVEQRGKELYYKPGGKPVTRDSGRFNWFARSPLWKDIKGFRGEHDVEKPVGAWNHLECVCDGDTITNILNGVVVNVGTKSSHTRGKIQFQSEGAEIFFRRIDLVPLNK